MMMTTDETSKNQPTNFIRNTSLKFRRFHTKNSSLLGTKIHPYLNTESKRGGFILQELRQSSKRNIYNGDVTLGNLFGQAKKLVSPSASRSKGTLN